MSFADYLKNRQTQFDQNKTSEEGSGNKSYNDERIWKPTVGQDGTGYAVIRFLPGLDVNKTSYSKLYKHAFKGPTGSWYIENCLSTLGQDDPVNQYNKSLWETGLQENKDIVSKQARKLEYFANILVLKDPSNPSNEGKVFIYKFGKKIFEKIQNAQNPKFDEAPFDPFDMVEGANFRIKIQQTKNGPNYDASSFESPAPITSDMGKLEAVYNAQHDVHELTAPDKFKSYDELKKKLDRVLGITSDTYVTPREQAPVEAPKKSADADLRAAFQSRRETAPASEAAPAPKPAVAKAPTPPEEDDDLENYFRSLAQ